MILWLQLHKNESIFSKTVWTTTLIISNDEKNDIIKTVKSLEDSGLLLKGVTETVPN